MNDHYYGNEYIDNVCMLLNDLGKRCTECKKPTFHKYIKDGKCPVCNGEIELKKLLHCPFCGGEPHPYKINGHTHELIIQLHDVEDSYFIECACGLSMSGENEQEIIKKWNTRIFKEPEEEHLYPWPIDEADQE